MGNILALVDFSDYSIAALKAAHHWSLLTGAKLHVFHKADLLLPGFADAEFKEGMAKELVESGREEVQELLMKALGAELPAGQIHVTSNRLLGEFSNLLRENRFEMVFLGVKGKDMLSGIFIGNTVMKVMNNFPLTIAAIPNHYENTGAVSLCIGVDPGIEFDVSALKRLVDPLGNKIGVLEFVTVVGEWEDTAKTELNLKDIAARFSDIDNVVYQVFDGDDVFAELKQFVKENSNAMLVVQKGGRDISDRIFRKFLVDELVSDATIPLIILP